MPSYSGRQYADGAGKLDEELRGVLGELRTIREGARKDRAELEGRLSRASDDLAIAILPELTRAALASAATLVGDPTLAAADPFADMAAEEARLRARIAEIAAEPAYSDREQLRAPGSGILTSELSAQARLMAELEMALVPYGHPQLDRLIEKGYGTGAYAVPFWRLSYYADWKIGDEILEHFPQMTTFAEARESYLSSKSGLEKARAAVARLEVEIAAGEALEAEMARSREALATVLPRQLAALRARIVSFLGDLDLATLAARLAARPDLDTLSKRWSGLSHQLRYVDAVATEQLETIEDDLEAERAKLAKEQRKYGSPKRAFERLPPEMYAKRLTGRTEKYRRRIERYQRCHGALRSFDRYDAGRLAADFVWWDLMTDGRLDGDFMPDVAEVHRQFPARRGVDLEDDAAAAAIAGADRAALASDRLEDVS
ncbi:MAG: hypothetical protein U0166_18890 [Acidobacteriota bacterium]